MKPFKQYIQESVCPNCGSPVPDSEDIEMELTKDVEAANSKDLKELPGDAGKTTHDKLHSVIGKFIKKMKQMHENKSCKDGDYSGAPSEQPMSDSELEAYYQDWMKTKKKTK
jgi:hypothetical protein